MLSNLVLPFCESRFYYNFCSADNRLWAQGSVAEASLRQCVAIGEQLFVMAKVRSLSHSTRRKKLPNMEGPMQDGTHQGRPMGNRQ